MNDRVLQLLGLIRRSGKGCFTEIECRKALSSGKSCLLLFACDASQRSVDRYSSSAKAKNIPAVMLPYEKDVLAEALGTGSCSIISINDPGFSRSVLKYFEGGSDSAEQTRQMN